MDAKLQARVQGPKPVKGFYYDATSQRYFKVPRPGESGYSQYQSTIEQCRASLQAEEAAKVELATPKSSSVSLHRALLQQSLGFPRASKPVCLHSMERIAWNHKQVQNIGAPHSHPSCPLAWHPNLPDHLVIYHTLGNLTVYDQFMELTATTDSPAALHHDMVVGAHLVALYSLDGTIEVYDLSNLQKQRSLSLSLSAWSLAWISESTLLCGSDRSAYLVDLHRNTQRKIFSGNSSVFSTVVVPSSREVQAYLGTRSGKIKNVDLRSKERDYRDWSNSEMAHTAGVVQLEVMQDPNYLMSLGLDGKVHLWDVRLESSLLSWTYCDRWTSNSWPRLCLSKDNSKFAVSVDKGDMQVYWTSPSFANEKPLIWKAPDDHIAPSRALWFSNWMDMPMEGFVIPSDQELIVVPT